MAGMEESPQRTAAEMHLSRARAHMEKRKVDRATEEAHLALEADPTFDDVRYLLAEIYEQTGERRKAVHQLEELYFRHKDNEELLARIARLDPLTAERHQRLASIAPDPFVAKRAAAADDAFENLDDMDAVDAEARAPVAAAPFAGDGASSDNDLVEMEDVEQPQAEAAAPTATHAAADVFADDDDDIAGPTRIAPEEYEYEDERKFRKNAMALGPLRELLREQRRLWASGRALDDLLGRCSSLTLTISGPATEAFSHATALLGASTTVPHALNDPSLWPLICGPMCAYVIVPAGAFDALNAAELKFLAGRVLSRVACEHVPLLDVAAAVLSPARPGSELHELLRQTAKDVIGGPEALGDEEAATKAKKALHTWRLRAELTADRAGLLCCGSLAEAASAIAKLSAPDASAAAGLSAETFKQKFEGQDLRRIANLGIDRDPETSEPYAFYRMLMLAWWSKQPAYARLRPQS